MLINNAGIVNGKPLSELTPSEMEYCLQVNTLSHIWVSVSKQAVLPGFLSLTYS